MTTLLRDDALSTLAEAEGGQAQPRCDSTGAQWVNVSSFSPGTAASSLGKAEDAAHTTGDVGVMMLTVRADSPAATGANGDYVPPLSDANGRLHTIEVNSGLVNAKLVSGTVIGATQDAGTVFTVTRTYTTSADMSTAAAISPAPTSSEKLYALDVIVSTDTAGGISLQEETSATVFAKGYLPANCGFQQLTPRGEFKTAVADKKFFGKHSAAGNISWTVITRSGA